MELRYNNTITAASILILSVYSDVCYSTEYNAKPVEYSFKTPGNIVFADLQWLNFSLLAVM